MANAKNIVTQPTTPLQAPASNVPFALVVKDGIHYNPQHNEYEVWHNNEILAYAQTQGQASRSYSELLRVHRAHVTRNRANVEVDPEPDTILVNHPNGHTTPLQTKTLYDLIIASAKYGYGSTDNSAAPIRWLKQAGHPQRSPHTKGTSIIDPAVQSFLLGYDLVDVEVQTTQVIRKYRKIQQTQEAHMAASATPPSII